jgi:hypothetical protein
MRIQRGITMLKQKTLFQKIAKTTAFSLAIILLVNLGMMALAIASVPANFSGSINNNDDMGFAGINALIGLFFTFVLYALPYLTVGYFGAVKRNLNLVQCVLIALFCFLITSFVTYLISYYLFVNHIYANPYADGFWHYAIPKKPPVGSLANINDALIELMIEAKLFLGFIFALIGGASIPILKSLGLLDKFFKK